MTKICLKLLDGELHQLDTTTELLFFHTYSFKCETIIVNLYLEKVRSRKKIDMPDVAMFGFY